MNNILTPIEFADLKLISKKYDTDKVEQAISQAHGDLREALGDAFFFDLMKNQADIKFYDLLNGSEFIKDELVLYHDGLKALLADYAYARYLYEINLSQTPFGMVTKQSQDSQPVDRNIIRDLVKQANQDASRKWSLIERYLNEEKDVFTIWAKQQNGCGVDNNSSSFNSAKFTFLSSGK